MYTIVVDFTAYWPIVLTYRTTGERIFFKTVIEFLKTATDLASRGCLPYIEG